MNSTKTAITMIIAMVAMIGMTGFAMAGSTTQTYVGDGTYTTSWSGNGGTMDIYTSTGNGRDHLAVDYREGDTNGYQTGDTNGWTVITREVETDGRKTSVSAVTIDNSGDLIAIDASAKRGGHAGTYLRQTVGVNDDANYDAVVSGHVVNAYGKEYSVSVVALAGYDDQGTLYNPYDDTYSAATMIDIGGKKGGATIFGIAGVGSNTNGAASGQAFIANAYTYGSGHGEADITAQGDNAGIGSFIHDDGMEIQNDGTTYYAEAEDETYINQYNVYNDQYRASGYIYAVTP